MRRLIGIAALVLTWVMLFYSLLLVTELVLVPWDTAIHRPEVGTWQRTLNDFFEVAPGSYSIAILLTGISIVLAYRALRRSPKAGLHLAVLNLIFVLVLFVAVIAAALINNHILFPYPPVLYDPMYRGFHRSILPVIAISLVCAGWFMTQRRVARPTHIPTQSRQTD